MEGSSGAQFLIFDGIVTQRLVESAAKVGRQRDNRPQDRRARATSLTTSASGLSGTSGSSSRAVDSHRVQPEARPLLAHDRVRRRSLDAQASHIEGGRPRDSKLEGREERKDEYSRPDKGERVKVTIALSVEEVHLDSSIERIRVRGTIVEASDESVTKGGPIPSLFPPATRSP